MLDGHARIVAWNDWIARASRISKQSALGKSLLRSISSLARHPPAGVPSKIHCRSAASSILTHTLNQASCRCAARMGSICCIISSCGRLRRGRSTHCLLQISDVTVSVTRERVLRDRQNARYHAIVDSAPDAIITTAWTERSTGSMARPNKCSATPRLNCWGRISTCLLDRTRDGYLAAFAGDDRRDQNSEPFKSPGAARRQGPRTLRCRLGDGKLTIVFSSRRSGVM